MKTKFFLFLMVTAIMSACSSNTPCDPGRRESVVYISNTTDYYAVVFIDSNKTGVLPNSRDNLLVSQSSFSHDIKVELHEMANAEEYYKAVEATLTTSKRTNINYDYKLTINNKGITWEESYTGRACD